MMPARDENWENMSNPPSKAKIEELEKSCIESTMMYVDYFLQLLQQNIAIMQFSVDDFFRKC